MFDALPDELREGWETARETIVYEDTPQRRRIRMQHARITDPRLQKMRSQISDDTTEAALQKSLENADFRDIPEADVREILYALGPDMLSSMIQVLLKAASTDKDIEEATAYSVARHLFFGQHGQ